MVTNARHQAEPQAGAGVRPVNRNETLRPVRPPGAAGAGRTTGFFIPGMEADLAGAERVYSDLRADAEADSGGVAHKRRILRIACRRQGADCTIEVGDPGITDGGSVIAILQFGRETFTIHCGDPDDPARLTTTKISRRTVYAVTDFD